MDATCVVASLFLTLLLVHHTAALLPMGLSFHTEPPNGTVITAFDYQQHIMITCEVREDGNLTDTLWTRHTAEDLEYADGGSGSGSGSGMGELSSEIILNPDEDPRFSIEGPGGSILVIDLFAPELNGSLVYCRDPILEQLGGLFPLQSTPLVVITDPKPGPIIVEEFSTVTIFCDIQHENVNQQHWVVQGEILPDGGEGPYMISGPHQSVLTVENFTEALDGTVIMCQIAFHGNIQIAQFSLHADRGEFPLRQPGVEYNTRGEDCSTVDTSYIRQNVNRKIRDQLRPLATLIKRNYY